MSSGEARPARFRFCATCGQKHRIGARFCGRCGAPLCAACGATLRQGSRYCPRCGQPLAREPAPPPETPSEPLPDVLGPLPSSQPLYAGDTSPWLTEFVNRQEAISAFEGLLLGKLDRKRMLLLHGPKGIGKSFLLRRLQSHCQRENALHVWIELGDPRGVNYLKIMRDVRDRLGTTLFQPFTDLLNFFTTERYTMKLQVEVSGLREGSGGGVSIGGQASVTGAVAGRDAIVIRDNYLSAPRTDIDVDSRRMQDALTERFLVGLTQVTQQGRVVCMFDDVDRLEETTAYWLWHDFLARTIDLANLCIVLTASALPPVERPMRFFMEEAFLPNLAEPHVAEYLKRRGVAQEDLRGAAGVILASCQGKPDQMADLVELYLKMKRRARS